MTGQISKKREWRAILICLLSSLVLIACAAALNGSYMLRSEVNALVDAIGLEFLSTLVSRLLTQRADYTSVLGMAAVWLTSPFTGCAGYIFTRRIIRGTIEMQTPVNMTSVASRILLCLLFISMLVFCVIVLPGIDSVLCRGCESKSTIFLLTINALGMCCIGAAIGYFMNMASILLIIKRN